MPPKQILRDEELEFLGNLYTYLKQEKSTSIQLTFENFVTEYIQDNPGWRKKFGKHLK